MTQLALGADPALEAKYLALQERIVNEKSIEENQKKLLKQLTVAGDPKDLLVRVKTSRAHAVQRLGSISDRAS